ncbi:hypothetical protein MNBD_DELTA01-109 [hydrothermal vent metagenome]|uniref:Calcineurin-like phosphoesterase domain-containing protein n=1 Tax=hydrothermal vent metagenome TaxID=652676 RepID=A0A3B0QLA7_9ZZZZ
MSRKIFFSDVHIGAGKKIDGYEWFNKHAELTNFLNYIKTQGDIEEVVILGDFLDNWICPADDSPPIFADIINAQANKTILDALASLAENKKVIYITGNHDMTVTEADVDSISPEIIFKDGGTVTTEAPSPYTTQDILAEHGHAHAMFNAPDYNNKKEGCLPLGYYISRLVAVKDSDGTAHINKSRLIKSIWSANKENNAMGELVLKGFLEYAGKDENFEFQMRRLDGTPYTEKAKDVIERYKDIYKQWKYGSRAMAVIAEFDNLKHTASKLSANNTKPIVMLGHSHEICGPKLDTLDSDPETQYIYANCGAWTKDKDNPTYIETEKDDVTHTVRLMKWQESDNPQQIFIASI